MSGAWKTTDARLRYSRIYAIVQTTSSSVSLVASITMLFMIFRSHQGLSTTSNRLLFGLCLADILSSSALSLSTMPIPNHYVFPIWNARGTITSCDVAGIVTFLGTSSAPLYNCSLCLYYLAVIKYNIPEDEIHSRLEKFFHSVSILFPIIGAVAIQLNEAFNPILTVCWIAPSPFQCDFKKDEECVRGENYLVYFILFSVLPVLILPCIICITMTKMYSTVRKNEKNMLQYSSQVWIDRINRRASENGLSIVQSTSKVLYNIRENNQNFESQSDSNDDEEMTGKRDCQEPSVQESREILFQNSKDDEEMTNERDCQEPSEQKSRVSLFQNPINNEEMTSKRDCQEPTSKQKSRNSLFQNSINNEEMTGDTVFNCQELTSKQIRRDSLFQKVKESWSLNKSSHTGPLNDSLTSARNFSNRNSQRSRSILYSALAYSFAYSATYVFYIVIYVFAFIGKEPGFTMEIIFRVFTPLQGFFNFLVFLNQRAIQLKNSDQSISWKSSFFNALVSRGPRSPHLLRRASTGNAY